MRPPNAFAFEADSLLKLDSLSIECLQTRSVTTCRKALINAEVLQREAASRGDYPCQSRLLGLEADLLMLSFDDGRDDSELTILKEIKLFCRNL